MTIKSPNYRGSLSLTLLISLLLSSSLNAIEFTGRTTFVVSPVSSSPETNGQVLMRIYRKLLAAPPSATSPFLLKLNPGVYDIGGASLQLPRFMDLEGSGQNVTLVRGNVTGLIGDATGVISTGPNSMVRQLTVENYVDEDFADSAALALSAGGNASYVTAISTGRSPASRAILTGNGLGGKSKVSDVTAIAATRAVQTTAPGLDANNLVARGEQQGIFVSSGGLFIRNSRISGKEFSVLTTSFSDAADFIGTQIDGAVICFVDNCRCSGAYDENLESLSKACGSTLQPTN